MNYGLPSISTASGGPEDLIINGKNGYITNLNSNRITKLCIKLIENKDLYISMAENSVETANDKFNSKILTDQIIDSFNNITLLTFFFLILIWILTFFKIVPIHNKISINPNINLFERLIQHNLIRTIFWILKFLSLLLIFLF